jgi:hypothetical protein
MLQAIELPASVADLDAGLSNVDRDALTHVSCLEEVVERKYVRISFRGGFSDESLATSTAR